MLQYFLGAATGKGEEVLGAVGAFIYSSSPLFFNHLFNSFAHLFNLILFDHLSILCFTVLYLSTTH